MRSEFVDELCGIIYHRTLILRGRTIWVTPIGAGRSGIRPLVTFQAKQTSRYNFHYNALSAGGGITFQVDAVNPPLVGLPNFVGTMQTEKGLIADIICNRETMQILSIKTESPALNITATKILERSKESDISISEDSMGELVRISRHGFDETFQEQLATLLDLGLCRRGVFRQPNPLFIMDPVCQCLLAALCIYFYQLEPLYNSEGSFG
jgi:hypothetical protein